jgi:2-oxoglutarate ferredoxin oxidoreductase subunit gamma
MGGQGIIFSGIVLARAAALYERPEGRELYAVQTQSYGPAARGESSKCDVVISDRPTFHPFVERPDFLVVLSQPAYERYIAETHPTSMVLLDEDAVESRPDLTYYDIPALRRAEEMGAKGSANMLMLGALVQISGIISRDAVSKAIVDQSPMGMAEANLKALREGWALGRAFLSEG